VLFAEARPPVTFLWSTEVRAGITENNTKHGAANLFSALL
jgi:hypothetical protein